MKENPLQDIPLLKKNTIVPFVFSPEQTDQLLAAICKRIRKTKYRFLRDLAFYNVVFASGSMRHENLRTLKTTATPLSPR